MKMTPVDCQKQYLSFFPFILVLFYGPIFNVYSPTTSFGTGIPDIGLYELSILLWVITLLFDLLFGNHSRVRWSFWHVNLGLFTFFVFISVSWSFEGYTNTTVRRVFFSFIIPFAVATVSRYYIQKDNFIKILTKHAAICCLALSVLGLVKFATGISTGAHLDEVRAGAGKLSNPNAMAFFLVMNIPVLLYALRRKLLNKSFILCALMISSLAVMSTISRKGVIMMIFCYIVYGVFIKNAKVVFTSLILIILSLVLVFTMDYFQRFNIEIIESQIESRTRAIDVGLELFKESPIIGRGFEGFYHYGFGKWNIWRKYDAHNNYVTVMTDYGLIGLFLFLNIFLIPLFISLRKLLSRAPVEIKLRGIVVISIIIPFMTGAFFAGGLLYNELIFSLLYTYITFFALDKMRKHNTDFRIS